MNGLAIQIPQEMIDKAVYRTVERLHLVPADTIEGKTIGLDDFRKKYCASKAPDWVRIFIFDKFKPDWVLNVHPGRGKKTVIFEYPAAKWMNKHRKQIDWSARL